MFQSMTDGPIWEKEFALLVDQEHFEKVSPFWISLSNRIRQ